MRKIAIVTRGASGIGRTCVEALTADGHEVVIADLNEEVGQQLAGDTGTMFVKTDLAKRDYCKNVIEKTLVHLGQVDILVNNGGYQHVSPPC